MSRQVTVTIEFGRESIRAQWRIGSQDGSELEVRNTECRSQRLKVQVRRVAVVAQTAAA